MWTTTAARRCGATTSRSTVLSRDRDDRLHRRKSSSSACSSVSVPSRRRRRRRRQLASLPQLCTTLAAAARHTRRRAEQRLHQATPFGICRAAAAAAVAATAATAATATAPLPRCSLGLEAEPLRSWHRQTLWRPAEQLQIQRDRQRRPLAAQQLSTVAQVSTHRIVRVALHSSTDTRCPALNVLTLLLPALCLR
jgi:hypothetical protein